MPTRHCVGSARLLGNPSGEEITVQSGGWWHHAGESLGSEKFVVGPHGAGFALGLPKRQVRRAELGLTPSSELCSLLGVITCCARASWQVGVGLFATRFCASKGQWALLL